mgnify:CR=1 FL=1
MTEHLQGVNIKDFIPFCGRSFYEDIGFGVLVADGVMGTTQYVKVDRF